MAECLTYASGGAVSHRHDEREPRHRAAVEHLRRQRDSLALLDHGWIQVYAEDNQEALDLALMAYAVAEDAGVRTPSW